MPNENNKGAIKAADLSSLIHAIVVHYLESVMYSVSKPEMS